MQFLDRRSTLLLALSASFALSACADKKTQQGNQATPSSAQKPEETKPLPKKEPPKEQKAGAELSKQILISTSMGDIKAELFADKAPKSVANFLAYVDAKHFDGTIFHRVIDNFMIQGGGFDPSFTKRPTNAPIQNEADNGLTNDRGTLAMARTSDPHSATAQFFINVKDNAFLNHKGKAGPAWGYTVFGRVTEGMDIVDKMKAVKTGPKGPFGKDAPQEDIVIKSITRI